MCTAVTYRTRDHYFGRNFDYELSYGEQLVVTPRRFPLPFRCRQTMHTHYAMIGVAALAEGIPLYYDATNECGLSVAGLNFPEYAAYLPMDAEKDNIAPFELIPWVLGQCKSVAQARELLGRIHLTDICFSPQWPLSPLHWMIADRNEAIVVEPLREGVRVYDNPVGVLTNSPPFDYHMTHLRDYMGLGPQQPENRFSRAIELTPYSRGMGAMGLPGDLSSASRFVKAAFTRLNAVSEADEASSISQFFHILSSVAQQRGCVPMDEGLYEVTRYSSCCNTDKGIYYYTTYENSQITAVHMHRENLDGCDVIAYPLLTKQEIAWQN